WALLIDAAERHRLAPLVLEGMRALPTNLPAPPSEFQARLENVRNLELAKAVVRLHHVDELGAVALREGMELYLLKGAAFATTLYRDPGLRPMSDIDVLVSRKHFESWSRELEALGYSLVDVSDHANCYRRGATGVLVELHRELTSAADFLGLGTGMIFERSRPLDAPSGVRLCTLSWEDHLLHLCLHASFQHGFRQPAVNAWDARAIVERADLDLEAFVERARGRRLAPWVYGGLAMTAAVFESPRLTSLLSALADSVPRSVTRKVLRFRPERLLAPGPDAIFGTPLARLDWTGWNLTTLTLLWEISRPRSPEIRRRLGPSLARILQLARNHGLASLGSTSKTTPALSMGPTPASLGEVR
ncbi:MAG: nucleotidyltransferase domain-containing protein, partial [Vicinamibacteria bacterium]